MDCSEYMNNKLIYIKLRLCLQFLKYILKTVSISPRISISSVQISLTRNTKVPFNY